MRPRSLPSLALAACTLALLLPAAAPAAPVATPAGATAVREYQGTIVFSQFVGSGVPRQDATPWRLAIRRPGAAPELLDVPPADRPFDADIGPAANGRPQLIYRRCSETCDLFVHSLRPGTGERPVRNANDPDHDDVAPTLWRGRIAWARIYGEQRDRKVVVYTKTLTAPRAQRSTRLPGVPVRRCGDVERRCGPTTGRTVEALELHGDHLAQVVDYGCTGCSGIAQSELRLVSVSDRTATPVAFQVVGLSGQSLLGPSFHGGTLGWYRACLGDPGACQHGRATPFRYRLSTREAAQGAPGPVRLDGFADTGALLYEVVGCNLETSGGFNAGCRIEELPAPAYAPARLPRRD
jgi:hypothetical protein